MKSTALGSRPKTVSDYIAQVPTDAGKKVKEMRALIRSVAPGATEELKWGMPAFLYTRIVVMYAGCQHHIGFYPTPSPLVFFAKELTKWKTSKGGVQFPLDKPLPRALIKKIVRFRIKELKTQDKKWKPSVSKKLR